MFETAPITAPNAVLYVVLPPDLSHRAIQILVQYMYSGEATVSNDILNEVLRGGEILKIRGLCRTPSSSSTVTSSTAHHHQSHHHHHQQNPHQHHHQSQREPSTTHYGTNGTRPSLAHMAHTQLPSDIYVNKCSTGGSGGGGSAAGSTCTSSRYVIDHSSQQFRGLGASLMPKDSPVIVKSPKLTQLGLLAPVSAITKHLTSGISVNKEVAIDPEDKCCYQAPSAQQEHQLVTSQPTLPPTPSAPITCSEIGCSSCPMSAAANETEPPPQPPMRRRQRSSHSDDHHRLERDYVERPPDESPHCERDDLNMNIVFDQRLRRESACDRVRDYYVPSEHFDNTNMNTKPFAVEQSMVVSSPPPPPHSHSFLAIKQEPSDWSNVSTTNESSHDAIQQTAHRPHTPSMHSPKQPLDFKMPLGNAIVKLEANNGPHSADEDDKMRDYTNYKLLVCEICQKTFEDSESLVRHLETHAVHESAAAERAAINQHPSISGGSTASGSGGSTNSSNAGNANSNLIASNGDTLPKSYVPKKRRRISQQENNTDHVTLLCDLCSTSFETPAEWVRHMNSQHTEIELAMFNSKKDGEQKPNTSASASNSNNCTTTASSSSHHHSQHSHKKYTNRQTLMLHKRSHTNSSNLNISLTSTSTSPSGVGTVQCDQLNTTTSSHA